MRSRRGKKISQKQFADEIQEPESAVAMAERGVIPAGNDFFVRKIEQFLGIRISKKTFQNAKEGIVEGDKIKKELLGKFEQQGEFDEEMTKNLTISDLKELKEKKKKWWQFGKKKDFEDEEVEIEYEDFDEGKSQTF